jgi:signal transduction histidine kinase
MVTITLLHCYKDTATFTILVKNDGHLIPAHLKEKIFEPFFRIKDAETKTGSGIGLALARSLAMIHNGSLTVEDIESDNNVFSLTLPIYSL